MPARKVSVESTAAKPSLASLKPDKTKGDAAQKRAIKRLVATASKKSTPGRIKAIKDNLDINTIPKAANTKVKKATLRETEKKLTITTTKTNKRVIKKILQEKKSIPSPFPISRAGRNDLSIKLPSNISIRAREKALVLLNAVLEDFDKPAERISLVSGLCFVLLGSYLALSFSGLLPGSGQEAQLLNTAGTTSLGTESTVTDTTATVEERPIFKALDQVPPELTANSQYTFSFTNATNVGVFLYSLESGTRISLNVEKLVESTYRYTIEASKLQPGGYVIKTVGESPLTHTKYTYELGQFRVPAPTLSTADTSDPARSTSQTTDTTTSSVATETTPDDSTDTTSVEESSNASTTSLIAAPVTTIAAPKIKLVAPSELKGQVVLKLYAPTETRFVELYARPTKSINSRYLGLAEKQSDGWYYFFNTLNQPNGDYELYGRTRINDTFVQSNSVNSRIANPTSVIATPQTTIQTTATTEPASTPPVPPTATSNTTTAVEADQEISLSEEAIDIIATPVRTFSEANFLTSSSTEETDPVVVAKADAIFTLQADPLRDVLKRYAVAVQAGDEVMLRTLEEEFKEIKNSILKGVLDDSSLNSLADNISHEFDGRLEGLKKRIDTFEGLRRSAGTEDVAVDTDGDGISDFDENNLYRTDARAVDSDQDGFTDGIEIMRGYDPKNPAGEVAIDYELPQDTIGLEQAEVLKVDAVFPSIKQTGEERVVQSEIRGKALPNSYVTLYIFSTPTIVTVRTDDEGAFIYTFEKELEDGEHEVYAAVTDNSGSVIAHSKPFRFIKQAEAFTPVDAAQGGEGTLTLADLKQFELYKSVIGLGVLALGIVLLMLGFSLRHNRQDPLIVRDDIKVA